MSLIELGNFRVYLLATLTSILSVSHGSLALNDFYQGPGVSAAEILRGRGYTAEELFVETSTGYILRVTKGTNPLIEGGSLPSKVPILFIHGVLGSANNFLLNSFGVEPKDFTNASLSSLSLDELKDRLADEPSAKSLPLLASNCGHEIWLLDKRGVTGSQELRGDFLSIKAKPSQQKPTLIGSIFNYFSEWLSPLTFSRQVLFSFDRKFWNYSLDEQARTDFPEVVDFVLAKTDSKVAKVSVVGHSAGGAMALMALSLYPDELPAKLASCILWSPAYATSNDNPGYRIMFAPLFPIEELFVAPMPPPFLTNPVQAALMTICSLPGAATTLCEGGLDLVLGQSDGQEPVPPQFFGSLLFATSSHELAQLGQTIRYPNHTIHAFDFRHDNYAAYGQATPPAYDLSVLRRFSSLSFYAGATDGLVTPADVGRVREQLRVPSQLHTIDTTFNHVGYFFHKDAPRLAIIPSFWEIENLSG